MGIPIFNGEELATDGYLVFSGSAEPSVTRIPRLSGVIIQETGKVTRKVILKAFIIKTGESTRSVAESFQYHLGSIFAGVTGTLSVNGNAYHNCTVASVNPVSLDHNKIIIFDIEFIMGEQEDVDGNALTFPQGITEVQGFSRGDPCYFLTEIPILTGYRTFYFWHHLFSTISTQFDVNIMNNDSFNLNTAITMTSGGLVTIQCQGWLLEPDISLKRKAIESYFNNIINGPMGLIGDLVISGNLYMGCMLINFSMGDNPTGAVEYNLTFIRSIC